MNDEQEKETIPTAVLDVVPPPLQLIEGYLKQAEEALTKVNASLEQLKSLQSQRERELITITGQKELLLALQKQIASVTKIESKA